jgi:hypothetical protein
MRRPSRPSASTAATNDVVSGTVVGSERGDHVGGQLPQPLQRDPGLRLDRVRADAEACRGLHLGEVLVEPQHQYGALPRPITGRADLVATRGVQE